MKHKKSPLILNIILYLLAVIQITPLILTFLNTMRTEGAIKKSPIGLPESFNFTNYVDAWIKGGYTKAFLNSIKISVTVSLLVLVAAIITGYFLSRYDGRFNRFLIVYYGIALSIPIFSFMVPLYFTFAKLNLVNTHLSVILIYSALNLPFNIMLARTFIKGIPISLDEAARLDGCSTYQIIFRIIVPLSKPIITTILLIIFVTTWNEFTLATTFLQRHELKTAATRFVVFVGERGSDLSLIYTAGMITLIPIIGVFLALQNYFIDGMTAGSVKE